MRFIPKKKTLTEAEVNPLDTNTVDITYDEQYKQAIMGAISSETSACNEYDQILALEENVTTKSLVELFHDTLEDIKREEVKHLAQLTTQMSKVDTIKKAFEDGVEEANTGKDTENSEITSEENTDENKEKEDKTVKESLTESVQAFEENVAENRLYNKDKVEYAIFQTVALDDRQQEEVYNMLDRFPQDMTAEEVDKYLWGVKINFGLEQGTIDAIENILINSKDPAVERQEDRNSDLDFDIMKIEDMVLTVYSQEAKDKLNDVIDYLKSLKGEF